MQPTQYGRNLSKTGAEQARLIGDCGFAYNNTFTFPNCFGVCKPNDSIIVPQTQMSAWLDAHHTHIFHHASSLAPTSG